MLNDDLLELLPTWTALASSFRVTFTFRLLRSLLDLCGARYYTALDVIATKFIGKTEKLLVQIPDPDEDPCNCPSRAQRNRAIQHMYATLPVLIKVEYQIRTLLLYRPHNIPVLTPQPPHRIRTLKKLESDDIRQLPSFLSPGICHQTYP